jgi:hypothetical protein
MEARIERIANPLSVHWDTNTTQFDASDWNYAFISDVLTEDEFEARYPKASKAGFEPGSDYNANWRTEDQIRVAEYWQRKEEKRKIALLSDGNVIEVDKIDGELQALFDATGVTVLRERGSTFHVVTRRMITSTEILEESIWPGSMIPICPVWGEEIIYEGKRYLKSLVRDAKDPQMMLNFWRSATTELVALAPRAPWVGPEGFIPKGKEEVWRTANTRSHAYLEFDPRAGGAPQRQPFAGAPAGAIQEALSAADDMKSIMGIHDASLGARSNETSGKAIMARQREGDVATFHFIDNLNRAIQYAGRVLVEIIPSIYSERQAIQILGPDDAPKVVDLTKTSQEGKLYDFTVGKYDVTVKTGPSFTTQRMEAQESLVEIMRNVPAAAPVLGDILVQNMDWPGADQVSKRLKLLLPPEIQQAEQAENQDGLPPEAQQAIMIANQQVQAGQQEIQQLQAQLQQAAAAPDMAKLQIEQIKAQSEAAYKQAQIGLEQERLALEARKVALAESEAQAKVAMEAARYVDEKANQHEAMMQSMMQPVAQEEPEEKSEPAAPQVIVVPGGSGVRNIAVHRGPDGRIIGAQVVDQ